jgi:hypothetical protein
MRTSAEVTSCWEQGMGQELPRVLALQQGLEPQLARAQGREQWYSMPVGCSHLQTIADLASEPESELGVVAKTVTQTAAAVVVTTVVQLSEIVTVDAAPVPTISAALLAL